MTDTFKNSLANCRIVLCETHHPGNIGAAARAMKTMGLSALYLVKPQHFPSAEATRRASRASGVLEHARVCETLSEALSGVTLAVACSARTREIAAPEVDARVPRRGSPLWPPRSRWRWCSATKRTG